MAKDPCSYAYTDLSRSWTRIDRLVASCCYLQMAAQVAAMVGFVDAGAELFDYANSMTR